MSSPARPNSREPRHGLDPHGFLLLLTISGSLASLPCTAYGKGTPPPDSLGLGSISCPGHGSWGLLMGEASADTLTVAPKDAFQAAIDALQQDSWQVFLADSSTGQIVTCWKPLNHFLVRLFAGRVEARCFADVQPLGDQGSTVTFRGALSTKHSLEGNPILPFAKRSYREAAWSWHNDMRLALGLEPMRRGDRKDRDKAR